MQLDAHAAPAMTDQRPVWLLVRNDDLAPTLAAQRLLARRIAAALGEQRDVRRCDERTFAVALDRDHARAAFLAERVRLTVAATPDALTAATASVAIVRSPRTRTAPVAADACLRFAATAVKNRVVTL